MSINSGQESRNRELALCAARGGGSRRYGLLFSGYFRQTQKIYVHFFPKEERRGELSRVKTTYFISTDVQNGGPVAGI